MYPHDNANRIMFTRNRILATTIAAIGIVSLLTISISTAMYTHSAEALENIPRRISGSWVESSIPHNAEGHQSHQVVHFVWPQAGQVYDGKVTFTASKGVDIIAIHDISNQKASGNLMGIKTWKVEGKTYAVTTLMSNVTAGTVDFVGSELLAHSASSDPYTVAFSIDAITMRDNTMHNFMGNVTNAA